jgi:hypothetical protein
MPMIAFKSDREKTKQRFSRLMRYFSKEIFDEQKHRDCQFYKKSCRPSHPASFFYGKLDHVGNHYDLFRGRQPLRIAVVAQDDNGQTEFKSFHERSGEVRGSGARPFSPSTQDFSGERARSRNPHMRGTTNLLRLIFEIDLGCDYHSEFLRINGQSIHFFDAFALLNASLCTAASEKGSAKPTMTMLRNCSNHLGKALAILEPTLVIAQGGLAADGLRCSGYGSAARSSIEMMDVNDDAITTLRFSHPSARGELNWGNSEKTDYLLHTVKPSVLKAIRTLYSN